MWFPSKNKQKNVCLNRNKIYFRGLLLKLLKRKHMQNSNWLNFSVWIGKCFLKKKKKTLKNGVCMPAIMSSCGVKVRNPAASPQIHGLLVKNAEPSQNNIKQELWWAKKDHRINRRGETFDRKCSFFKSNCLNVPTES